MPRYTLTTSRMEILYVGDHRTFNEALEYAVSKGISIVDMDLRHLDLRGITLDGGHFHNCLFDDSHLQGANLSECTFTLCDFHRANLSGACLCYTDLVGCDLQTAVLTRADFAQAYLLHCRLPPASGTTKWQQDCHLIKDCYHPIPITSPQADFVKYRLKQMFLGGKTHTKDIVTTPHRHV